MKTLLSLTAMFACITAINAQNPETKNLGEFTGIQVDTRANVNIIQSDSDLVTIKSGWNKHLSDIKVENGMLIIHSAGLGECDVRVKNLDQVIAKDASVIKSQNTITSDNLKIIVSDASTITLNVTAKSVEATAHDASTLRLTGTADVFTVTAADASVVKASDFRASEVHAVVSDASKIKVWAVKKIDAKANDSGVISYKGDPTEKNTSSNDGGRISTEDGKTISSAEDSDKDDTTEYPRGFDHHFTDAYLGFGYVLGPDNKGAAIRYGKSREFAFGLGGGYRFFKWNGIGADIYYKATSFYLNQDSTKILPNQTLHDAEKVAFNSLGGLVFDRFFIGSMFFDGGIYYEWTFHSRHVTWDNNRGTDGIGSSTKTIDRQLSFANPSNYGVSFRLGFQSGVCLYFNYRMSNLFSTAQGAIAGPPELPPYVLGIYIGGF